MDKPLSLWLFFAAAVLVLLILDLGVLHRKSRIIPIKESLIMTGFYILCGLSFSIFVWFELGPMPAKEYLTGFLVEKSLAMDNLFVISMIFTYFAVPREYQYRVLFWGIVGVIILRGVMIGLGAVILEQFEWVLLLFAAFLIYSGIKMILMADADDSIDLSQNRWLNWLKRRLPITTEMHGRAFFVVLPDPDQPSRMKRYVTPLFITLIVVEFADLLFAVDSIPAIFAITTDPYIVYTSNIFAILGLRAMYFALDAIIHRFHHLKYAISLVLVFIGTKVLVAEFLGIQKIPASVSLGVTFTLLIGGGIYSFFRTRHTEAAARDAAAIADRDHPHQSD